MNLSCDKPPEADFSADPIRRRILKGTIAAAVLLKVLSVESLVSEVFADERSSSISTEKAELDTEQKIDRVEAEFSRFGEKILPQLHQFVESERLRAIIRKIFEAFENNKKNSSRKFWKQEIIPYGEENGFFYIFENMEGRTSMFNGVYRTVKLRPDFDPASIGRLSFFAHELVHVLRDNYYRRNVPEYRYRIYWSSSLVAVPSEEADAIAVQLEILNVATRGEFKKNIMEGKPSCVKTDSKETDKFLTEMAEIFFKKDWDSFVFFVKKWYQKKGARLFDSELIQAE